MMHSDRFSAVGNDIANLQRELSQKANSHEVSSLNSNVDRLERALRDASSEIAGLRHELQNLQEIVGRIVQDDRNV